jgi:hypothetical protein
LVRSIALPAVLLISATITLAQERATEKQIAEVKPLATGSDSTATTKSGAQLEPVNLGAMRLTSTIEFGPRWRDRDGNEDVYRSHVNLGNGLKLFQSSAELRSPDNTGPLFDRLAVNLNNWGGDPYNTASVRVQKHLWYDFQYWYQKIDYFNFIPEFANPLFGQGVLLGQHSFDSARRMSNARLELFPDSKAFKVYAAYARNSSFGSGLLTANPSFEGSSDEFVLRRLIKNRVNDYQFGSDFRRWKLNFSFEQGFRTFADDQGLTQPDGENIGNDSDPNHIFIGEQIFLAMFGRSYHARGFLPWTQFALSSQPIDRLSFTARLYHSDSNVEYELGQFLTGVVFDRAFFDRVTSALIANEARPSKPYTVADGTVSFQVMPKLTVSNTFRGAHFVIAGSTTFADRAETSAGPDEAQRFSTRHIFLNSFMNEVQGTYAVTKNLMARAGHRFTHRRADVHRQTFFTRASFGQTPEREGTFTEETTLDTDTVLVGFTYRLRRTLRLALDYENGGLDSVFTRVDPQDFQRGRFRIQYRPNDKWLLTASALVFDQTRPNRTLPIETEVFLRNQDRSRSAGFSVSWFPTERLALDVDYTRGHETARISTVNENPQPLILYKEDSNVLHAGMDVTFYKDLRAGFGYRLVNSSGSFPINFRRPYARLSIPLREYLSLNLAYQHYGYNERGRSVQDYRANTLTTSLRLSF